MAKIVFLKKKKVYGVEYAKGDTLQVSESIRQRLINEKVAKDAVDEVKSEPKKSDKKDNK